MRMRPIRSDDFERAAKHLIDPAVLLNAIARLLLHSQTDQHSC